MAPEAAESLGIIDTDIHERADVHDLLPYLAPQFRHYIAESGWEPQVHLPYTQLTAGGLDRADAKMPDGRPGGSDLGMLQDQVLDEYDHELGILTGWLNASAFHPGWVEFKTALMSAYNDWQIENWLDHDERLRGSIHLNIYDPQGATREVERLGDHPKMVQIMLYGGPTDTGFGEPQFHAVYEAAQRHRLAVGFHHSENSRTALGFHRYFVEWHTLVSQPFMSQAVSFIFNGVFDKFPELKLILVEGGFTYVPHLMWRADQNYRELRSEVPWVKRLPSDIIREQVRFATQPTEEMSSEHFNQLIDQMGSEELLCFSTDYPHWDFDSPWEALPQGTSEDLKRKIFSENARALYPKIPAKAEVAA